jgi:hypothetical protein
MIIVESWGWSSVSHLHQLLLVVIKTRVMQLRRRKILTTVDADQNE